MAARFNRHQPALCAMCTRPLSVRERVACKYDPEMVCDWHAFQKLRGAFDSKIDASFWISEPSNPQNMHFKFQMPDEEPQTFEVNAADLFGYEKED